jgi:hypothetical protein
MDQHYSTEYGSYNKQQFWNDIIQKAFSLAGDMAQVLEHLPTKQEALNSNPSTTQKKSTPESTSLCFLIWLSQPLGTNSTDILI